MPKTQIVNQRCLMYPVFVILNKQSASVFLSFRLITILFFILLSAVPLRADFLGTVVKVLDGDSLEIVDGSNTLFRVRLQGIDAPERGQAFSNSSRKALSDLVFGKEVRVVTEGLDKYERFLGHVYVSELWINREMIRKGMAWHYKYFNKDLRLAHSEVYARYERLGLWADPEPTAPWIFRRDRARSEDQKKIEGSGEYWLNTSTGVRHNKSCKHFMKTRRGRLCGPDEGRPCGECGG